MSERVCRLCGRLLVRREGERWQGFSLRRFCSQRCKNKLHDEVEKEKRALERAALVLAPPVMDFALHEIVPRDGGYARIYRPLPERSLIGCSAAWMTSSGGES